MVALVALVCTLLLIPLFSLSRLYRRLPCRPLMDVSTWIVTFTCSCRVNRVGVIDMKALLSLLGRYALTLSAVAAATCLAFILWKHYAQTPWTRDGRVRADVVQIAPDVSGPVISVAVRDNQWVNQGDVLYSIDPRWLKLAVASAQADVESKRHEMLMRQDAARRRTQIKDAISARICGKLAVRRTSRQPIIMAHLPRWRWRA